MPALDTRITVTGGAGFLGSHVVAHLRAQGADVFVPRHSDYDLVDGDAVRRLYRDARPQIVVHLAAQVGGIGANRANPGRKATWLRPNPQCEVHNPRSRR